MVAVRVRPFRRRRGRRHAAQVAGDPAGWCDGPGAWVRSAPSPVAGIGIPGTPPIAHFVNGGSSMQLDIFADSRDTILRNQVGASCLALDFQGVRTAMAALAAEYPADALLSQAAALLAVEDLPRKVNERATLEELLGRCERDVASAAGVVLGSRGAGWMQTHVWSVLAGAATGLPFDADHPDACAANLWLRAGEWNRAAASVEGIPSWRRLPVPLGWRIVAAVRAGALDVAWPWIFELAWMAPSRFIHLTEELADPVLRRMMTEFDRVLDGDDASPAWFPAFALVAEPPLARLAASAQPARDSDATRAYSCLLSLLALEKQGRQADIGEVRKRLRGLNERLFRRYLATR